MNSFVTVSRGRACLTAVITFAALMVGPAGASPADILAVPADMQAAPADMQATPALGQNNVLAYADLFFPLALDEADVFELPTVRALTPEPTDEPSPTVTPTATATITPTPEPTEVLPTGRIHGRMMDGGVPMAAGFGIPLTPQIELRRRTAGEWELVAKTVTTDGGLFEFVDPPPLEPGEVYQVVWVNDVETGVDIWVDRWWSRLVAEFGDGTDVDVGVFELADLRYVFPCHDCHRSLPITFEWTPRPNEAEVYRWSLFKGCGDVTDRHNAYRTQSLGHESEYTLDSPPPTFRYDVVYCWYIFIEDGENGTGWPFHDWRTAFLSLPLLERDLHLDLSLLATRPSNWWVTD